MRTFFTRFKILPTPTHLILLQSEADDIGRVVFSLKAPASYTSKKNNYTQTQLIAYVTDNHNVVTEFPRFYLYPNEWNRMKFTARLIELIENKDICTDKVYSKLTENGIP